MAVIPGTGTGDSFVKLEGIGLASWSGLHRVLVGLRHIEGHVLVSIQMIEPAFILIIRLPTRLGVAGEDDRKDGRGIASLMWRGRGRNVRTGCAQQCDAEE